MKKSLRNFLHLYLTFFKIGLFTFGGGYAMLSLISTTCVDKNKWISDNELLDIISVSESTPGPLSINVATFVGNRVLGLVGGIVATLGVISPSILIISIIAGIYDKLIAIEQISKALQGIMAVVVILISFSVFKLSKGLKNSGNIFINISFVILTILLKVFTEISSIFIIVISAATSILIYSLLIKEGGKNNDLN